MPQPTQIVSTPTAMHNAPTTRHAWMLGDVELDYVDIDNREPPIVIVAKVTEMFVNAALEAEDEKPDPEDETYRGAKRYLLRPGWVADLPGEYRLLTAGLIKTHLGHARRSCDRYEGALGLPPRQWGADVELTPDEQAACDDHLAAYNEHLDNSPVWADGEQW